MDPSPAAPTTVRGPAGLITTIIGLVLALIGTLAVPWGKAFFGISVSYFDLMDIANQARRGPRNDGFIEAYFGWLGLLVMVVVGVFGILACLPARAGQNRSAQRTATIVAAALAIILLIAAGQEIGDVMRVQGGPWVAGIGYILVLVGAAVGPARSG